MVRGVQVARGLTWQGVRWAFTTFEDGNWFPLTWLSHMADVSLFGQQAGRHHMVNVAIHAVVVALVFVLLRRLRLSSTSSAAGALLFAFHPLRVESVAWIAERKDVLSGFFFMLVLLAHAGYTRRPSLFRYLLVVFALALGLMSKPMLVTVPFVLLLLDYWPLNRMKEPGGVSAARLLREKVPLLLCALGAGIATMSRRCLDDTMMTAS